MGCYHFTVPEAILSFKLVMLLCLARPSCSADLSSLCIDKCLFKPKGVLFLPSELSEQSRQGKPLTDYFFASFLIPSSSVQWKLYSSICKWQKHWGRTPLVSLLQLLNLTIQWLLVLLLTGWRKFYKCQVLTLVPLQPTQPEVH